MIETKTSPNTLNSIGKAPTIVDLPIFDIILILNSIYPIPCIPTIYYTIHPLSITPTIISIKVGNYKYTT